MAAVSLATHRSMARQVTLAALGLVALVLVLVGLALSALTERSTRAQLVRSVGDTAQALAHSLDAADNTNRDWTIPEAQKKKDAKSEEEAQPPKEPLYKQLLEVIHSMWRASTMAVDMADKVTKDGLQERMAQEIPKESPTYSDPKVKRTGGP